jgi:tetratricopeptide (TPR) repeat protein
VGKGMMLKSLVLLLVLFGFSCAEKTVVVREEPVHRPPGLGVASEKALENGKKQLAKGHCRQAIHEFNKALEKDPRNFYALYWLGVAEGMCGYYPQAYDRLNLVIRYAPDPVWTARVYATLGLTLLYMERDEEAVLYFERAKNIDPRNELVAVYYEEEDKKHKKGKGKLKKKPRGEEGYRITLKWMD